MSCGACGSRLHHECRTGLGRCPTLGCKGTGAATPTPRQARRRRLSPLLAGAGCLTLGLFLPWSTLAVGVVALKVASEPDVPDRPWCRVQMETAIPIIEALEHYEARRGRYPPRLADLCPQFLQEVPQPIPDGRSGGHDWWYARTDHGFEFAATTKHWVSSFDVLMYRPDRDYSDINRYEDQVFRLDDWCYIVGGSELWQGGQPRPQRQ